MLLPNCGTCGRAPAVRPSQGTSPTSTPSLYVCCLHSASGENGGWDKVERSCHSHKGNRGLRPWPHDPDRSRECPRSLKFGGRVFPSTKASKSWVAMVCGAEHPDARAGATLLAAAVGNCGSGTLQQPWCETQVRQQEYLTQMRSAPDRRGGVGSQGDLLKIKFSWEAAQDRKSVV